MSLEQMLAFLLDKNPHWSDNFIDSLMKNPAKLVAVYTKELEEYEKERPLYNHSYLLLQHNPLLKIILTFLSQESIKIGAWLKINSQLLKMEN